MKELKKTPSQLKVKKINQKNTDSHTLPKVWQIPVTQNDRVEKSRNSAIDASPGSEF
ncbi:hypothetical protein [Emticicia sp.]|uniref:hypothetical protein n=1 Tax=Emticicia sp. TaxID=1930953 RepID=UPI003752216A